MLKQKLDDKQMKQDLDSLGIGEEMNETRVSFNVPNNVVLSLFSCF
jgi:hypothetical protein